MMHPGDHLGPYRLLELIGSGGMGHVFAAVHERLEQRVAIKLLSAEASRDPQLVARFLQEARALAQFQHPGVVRIHHCERLADGTAYFAMEHLEGLSLRAWMQRRAAPLSPPEALELGRQLAEVMVAIHAQGIVHRDLKPENVFLCTDDSTASGFRLKLLDFGIAKVPPANSRLGDTQVQTRAPLFLGTATYMAPEQCRNAAEVDGRADVYALGVLLFELLTGRPPFVSNEPVELIAMHVNSEPPSLQELAPGTPGALSAFIASMLSKAPEQRPTMLRCRDMLGRPWRSEEDTCPVPGLAPFTEAQAELFFGRKTELEALLALLSGSTGEGRRWVQLEGPSGIGKSSLVQAGLIPRLREPLSPEAPQWCIASMRPSYDPLRELARALAAAFAGTGSLLNFNDIEQVLSASPDALRALVTAHTPPGCRFLLILEQLEELFTLGTAGHQHIDTLIATALAAPGVPLWLLTTVRSDFIHRLEHLPSLARQLNGAARYHLRTMEEDALTQVIRGMAQRAGLRFSEGLPERMVQEARSEVSRLPLLGHALRGLWAMRSGALLTHERYEQLGGVGGALARQAEQLLDSMGEEGRECAKWLLLDLVQVGRGAPDTRRPRTREQVLAATGGHAQAEAVLMRLSGMSTGNENAEPGLRLVVLTGEMEPSRQRVELVHETLLHKVPSIVNWIDQERALLERQANLEVVAHAWEQAGCPKEGLPYGSLLIHYQGHPGSSPLQDRLARVTSGRAARFLEAARRLERQRIWLRRTLAVTAFLAVAAIALGAILASVAQQRAERNLQGIVLATGQVVSDADWKLSRVAHTLKVRWEMLRQADENLASLPQQEQQQPAVRKARIKTWHRRGDLAFQDESLAQADSYLGEALRELRQGLSRQPEDPSLVFLLALNHSKRGKVALARRQLAEARHLFKEALAILEPQPERVDDDYRRTLATSYSEQAELELEDGQTVASTSFADRALTLFEAIDGDAYDRSLLAEALCARGELARRAGDLKAADGYLQRAWKLGEQLVEGNPGNELFRWVLARAHLELAQLHAAEGQRGAAAPHARATVELGRALRQGEPENKRYALVLARGLLSEESLALAQGHSEQSGRARVERCALVDAFVRLDAQDTRFHRLGCR